MPRSMNATAWGDIVLSVGTPAAGDAMSTTLVTVGKIKEGTLQLSTEDGQVLELFAAGHVLLDTLKTEPKLKIACTVYKMDDATRIKFWGAANSGTGATEKLDVTSMITATKYSVKIATPIAGSETFEAPLCSVTMKPAYSEQEGWSMEVEFTVLKGATGKFFSMGIV